MRLEATARYLLKSNQTKLVLLIIGYLFIISVECRSQAYGLNFKENTALADALLLSSKSFGFKVAFDAQRLSSVYISRLVKGNTIEEFITNLLQNSEFTFLYKHGSYLIVNSAFNKPAQTEEYQLSGSVLDSETGEQLPFASIEIPTQNIVISTSTDGTFSIKNIVANPIHLIINYIGYYPVDTIINWTNPALYHTFKLKHKINLIDSVKIQAKKLEMVDYRNDVDFSTTINPSKLIDLPLLNEIDIFKTLQLLPGISYSENSSELSIRGGTSDQNLVLFDGQTLYNLSHFYGVFSSINPYMVKDIQVFKGGFDSRYGERISGIVDIIGKSGNQMKPVFIANLNLLDLSAEIEIPISKKLTIIGAGRRSFSDIYKTSFANNLFAKKIPVLGEGPNQIVNVSEPNFYFYDFNFKADYRVSDKEDISLSIYGGKDYFKNEYSVSSQNIDVTNIDSSVIYNYGASVNWQKQWNSSFFSALSIGSSGYLNKSYNNTSIDRLLRNLQTQRFLPDSINSFQIQNKNDLNDYFISSLNTINTSSFNQINFGFLFRYNDIYYHKDADKIYVYDDNTQTSWLTSIFLQDRFLLYKNLSVKPGVRISYYEGSRKLYFEPRFAAKYDFSENFSCRIASGRYYQFISQVSATQESSYTKDFWVLANDTVNPVLSANHYILGLSYKLKNFLFDAEAYYKDYDGIQEYLYLSQFNRNIDFINYFPRKPNGKPGALTSLPSYFINGSGKIYGIDFFVSYKTKHFTSWISYTLSKGVQKFDMINNGKEIPSLNDQTHQLSFSNMFNYGKWNVGSIALFSTGKPYILSTTNSKNLPILRKYGRMPNFFRLDLSTNYNFHIKSTRFKIGASVINLLNTQNYFDANTRVYDFENTNFSETNLIKAQNLSLNLFLQIAI